MRSLGAVDVDVLGTQIVLENIGTTKVRIMGIRVVKECGPPLSGTIFFSIPQGDQLSTTLGFDLDETAPAARSIDEGDRWGKAYFSTHTVLLEPGEQKVFEIKVKTDEYYCEYRFAMKTLRDRITQEEPIDNNGKPFRISASRWNIEDYPHALRDYSLIYPGGPWNPRTCGDFSEFETEEYRDDVTCFKDVD
ncbi:hypothetical protein Aple_001140 [Acrocarpospora pleiomorpha]|uniref:Uncharacterized protein n=2 Tax=Acrocarpospora pleiomorpha TaxID=90975 RepID=A0A5M3XAJ6_9ACTN|nr:hypothetical protein Aple_001140 [Acrocarpospora pleiomorpha]